MPVINFLFLNEVETVTTQYVCNPIPLLVYVCYALQGMDETVTCSYQSDTNYDIAHGFNNLIDLPQLNVGVQRFNEKHTMVLRLHNNVK